MNPHLEAALSYADRGWAVFPLRPRDKWPLIPTCALRKAAKEAAKRGETLDRPACRGECGGLGHGLYDATIDPVVVTRWWMNAPRANIGLRTGTKSGVWVLDVDVKAPAPRKEGEVTITGSEALLELEETHGPLPRTLSQITGSGGLQFFFRMPSDRAIRNRGGIVLPDGRRAGLDARGEGGLVVLPPSIHPNGTPYEWRDAPIADAPAWLLDLVAPPVKTRTWTPPPPTGGPGEDGHRRYVRKALEGICARISTMREGNRHDAIAAGAFTVGGWLHTGVDRAEAAAMLIDAGLACGKPRDEVVRAVESGLDRGAEKPRPIPEREPHRQRPPPPRDDDAPHARRAEKGPWNDRNETEERGMDEEQATDGEIPGAEDVPPPNDDDAPPPVDNDPRPKINVGDSRDEQQVVAETVAAILRMNDPPTIFQRSGWVVGLRGEAGNVAISEFDKERMLWHLRRTIRAVKFSKPKTPEDKARAKQQGHPRFVENPAHTPGWLASDLLAVPPDSLPPLTSVVTAPVFVGTGDLVTTPGYHAGARLFYAPPPGFTVSDIPLRPHPDDVAAAKELLFDTWLGEFHFEKPRDKAHAAALLFLPFVRPMIRGPTPLHITEAAREGTGKSLLAELLTIPALGHPAAGETYSHDDVALGKQLATDLREAHPYVFFDNVGGRIKSEKLKAVLTLDYYQDRILGLSESMRAAIHAIFVLSANNAMVDAEINRRSIRIRLDAEKTLRQVKQGYRIPRIKRWTEENRVHLLEAILLLIRSWLASGAKRVPGGPTRKSYEEWAELMGSLLAHVGVPGLLAEDETNGDMEADYETGEWVAFCEAWFKKHPGEKVSAGALVPLVLEWGHLEQSLTPPHSASHPRMWAIVLGQKLYQYKDRVFGEYQIVRASSSGNQKFYQVIKYQGAA
jgi:hypothetical protein